MERKKKNVLKCAVLGLSAGAMLLGSFATYAACASLPASRSTEFHGNPADNDLALAMAGNQWVVFDKIIRAFNESRGLDSTTPIHKDNADWSAASYDEPSNRYYIELIPPGQEANQIISGCMTLGNEKGTNFMPLVIRTKFDVFTSTNYTLMGKLASNGGFVSEALPYTKNLLTLMIPAGNTGNIGTGTTDTDRIVDATMDLLDPTLVVSEVDHINEGVHKGINKMYKAMDEYVRLNSPADVAALDLALAAVAMPQSGSPADTRTGVTTDFNLATNPECHYSGHASIPDNTLRMCEFAILNKANTHETRVHHVETPAKIQDGTADMGPVWVSELQFAQNAGDAVDGATMPGSVNAPVVYSIAMLSTVGNDAARIALAQDFIDFMRTPNTPASGDSPAQEIYEAGGFSHMCYGQSDNSDGCKLGGGNYVDDFAGGKTYP